MNPKTGAQAIRPIARYAGKHGRIYHIGMPLIFSAPVRAKLPRRVALSSQPPPGAVDTKNYVWAGHLEKCVDPDTGYVWYEPVVYIVEQAVHPNGRLVPK